MVQLTVQDLAIAVNTIDLCVERGAFKGNEIYNVGQLREKIAAVVIEARKQQEGAGGAPAPTESEDLIA